VITLGEFTHQGSLQNLLGPDPAPERIASLSNETQVSAQTPPCFIWHTTQDAGVPVENSLLFATALRRAGVPFELHLYEHGGHGLGLPNSGNKAPPWDETCIRWLKLRGYLTP
jgi:dipeptidyl aminopeptidase/acylaminoacyl peptidase